LRNDAAEEISFNCCCSQGVTDIAGGDFAVGLARVVFFVIVEVMVGWEGGGGGVAVTGPETGLAGRGLSCCQRLLQFLI